MGKKITVVISNYDEINNPYYAGGGAYAIDALSKRLAKKYKLIIVNGKFPHFHNSQKKNITRMHIGTVHGGPKIGQLMYQLLLPYYARKLSYDIWIESFTPPISTAFLPLFTRKPVIGLTHFLDSSSKSKEYRIPFLYLEKWGVKKYKFFIALTEEVKKRIHQINPQAIVTVIPNGIEPVRTTAKVDALKKHILFIGRIEIYQKGIDILIKAYSRLTEPKPPLVIAGSANTKNIKILTKIIKENDAEKNIHYVGKITGRKKYQIYKDSYFVVLPSRFETHPLVALEAMNYKIPLLTFDINGFKWIHTDSARKVKAFNTKDYTKQMRILLDDKALRKSISTSAYSFVRKFDWEKISLQYCSFIEGVHKQDFS